MIEGLADDAAADAAHDFKDDRGAGFDFKKDIFNLGYRLIGTPTQPSADIPSEWKLVNQFLGLASASEAVAAEAFKGAFMVEGDRGAFTRIMGDDISYRVQSAHVATKAIKGPAGDREWRLHGEGLYDFMNRGAGHENLVFTIDAANVPFTEGLLLTPAAHPTRRAKYILTREGITDGAGKANKTIGEDKTKQVFIEKVYDNDTSTVAYPATDTTRVDTLHETEMFYSKYPIHIPAVTTIGNLRATTVEFTNVKMTAQKDKFKSAAEGKAYTVSNLARKIIGYIATLLSGAKTGTSVAEREYHMCLQWKRAGDWLQVLACLAPERFGLPTGTRIRLVTEDRICFLFALKMGIDVVFTSLKDTPDGIGTEYWLLTFYKEAGAADPVRNIITSFPSLQDPAAGRYVALRNQYIGLYDEVNERLFAEFNALCTQFKAQPAGLGDLIYEQYMRRLIKSAIKLAAFRMMAPKLYDRGEETVFSLLERVFAYYSGRDYNRADYDKFMVEFPNIGVAIAFYRYQTQVLETAVNVKKSGGLGPEAAIAEYFTKIFLRDTIALENRYAIVDKLTFRARLFKPENLNENGMGVFTYLSGALLPEEYFNLCVSLNSIAGFITTSAIRDLLKSNRDQYTILVKIAVMLQKDSAAPPVVAVPTIAEIPTIDLLDSMFLPVPGGAAAAVRADLVALEAANAAEEIAQPNIEVSDFFAEQVLVAKRAQGHFGPEATLEARASITRARDVARAAGDLPLLADINALLTGGGSRPKLSSRSILSYNHNPLTTFYLVLTEINNLLECEDPDEHLLYKLSHIIERMLTQGINKVMKTSPKEAYKYIYSLEAFLLEGLAVALPNMSIEHFMAGIKENYYGIYTFKGYKRVMHISSNTIHDYVSMKPKHISIKELIRINSALLSLVLRYIKELEIRILSVMPQSFQITLKASTRHQNSFKHYQSTLKRNQTPHQSSSQTRNQNSSKGRLASQGSRRSQRI